MVQRVEMESWCFTDHRTAESCRSVIVYVFLASAMVFVLGHKVGSRGVALRIVTRSSVSKIT